MSIKLIYKDQKFAPLFWTQFFGALNDNLLKNALVVMIIFKGISLGGLSPEALVPLCSAIFIFPFFVFSPIAGQLSDKLQKAQIANLVKFAELAIMILAAFGFFLHIYWLLIFCLFLMGVHSTIFGPLKYGIIPELVSENNLVAGNAYVEVGTFLAILIGTIAGGLLVSFENGQVWLTGTLVTIAVFGIIASLKIPHVPLSDPSLKITLNPFPEIWKNLKEIYPQEAVFNSILGISWFWFFGAALLTLLPSLTKNLFLAGETVVTLFLAAFTIGIAIGSITCEKLSFDRVEIGLVPPASLGMTFFTIDLALTSQNFASSLSASLSAPMGHLMGVSDFLSHSGGFRILFDLVGIAICGGIFTVPLYSLLQQRSLPAYRSRVISSNNILNAIFMVVSSAILILFQSQGMSLPKILIIYAGLNLIVSFYIYSIVPEFTLRFFTWVLSRCLYQLHTHHENHIPKNGAALLVCNHVTFVDWLIIAASIKRPICFVMYYKFYQIPILKHLLRQAKVIPIAGQKEDLNIFKKAFDQVSKELRDGNLVCIFPEGMITTNGEMNPFRDGVEHILAKDPVPVIPMGLTGMWGSIFSHKDGKALKKIPRRIHFPVHLNIGKALDPKNSKSPTASDLQLKVKDLCGVKTHQ